MFIAQVAVHSLSSHLRDVYAEYRPDLAAENVSFIATYLYTIGCFGIFFWLWMIWAVNRGQRRAPIAATIIFVLGSGVSLLNLVVQEYGSTILTAPLGSPGCSPASPDSSRSSCCGSVTRSRPVCTLSRRS